MTSCGQVGPCDKEWSCSHTAGAGRVVAVLRVEQRLRPTAG